MSDREFTVGEKKFKLNKIDVFKQFHIVRRIAPILGEMIPIAQKIFSLKQEAKTEDEMFNQIALMSGPILNGFAKLSDTDSNFVLLGLCSAAEIFQPASGNWARVATDAGLMFQDLQLPEILQIAGRAFMFNMTGFFALLPQASAGGK